MTEIYKLANCGIFQWNYTDNYIHNWSVSIYSLTYDTEQRNYGHEKLPNRILNK